MYYAGIGSRKTPPHILKLMRNIGYQLATLDSILRSGGADGADSAFEEGANQHIGACCEIFLPWPKFNNHHSPFCHVSDDALELTAQYHPAWHKCSPAVQKLHARNAQIIFGHDLKTPVNAVICWTPGANGGGGTGQALRLAYSRKITIVDLGQKEAELKWTKWVAARSSK